MILIFLNYTSCGLKSDSDKKFRDDVKSQSEKHWKLVKEWGILQFQYSDECTMLSLVDDKDQIWNLYWVYESGQNKQAVPDYLPSR